MGKVSTTSTAEEVTSINTSAIMGWSLPHSSVSIPHKSLKKFAVNGTITSLATLFINVTSFFPREQRFVVDTNE